MDSSSKASAKKPPTGGQQAAGGVAGKKRKKKKNAEKKTGEGTAQPSLVVHAAMVPVEPHRSAGLGDGRGSLRPVYERCSSSSSIENSKPERKLGRFDFSSSDAMSISLTSSSTAMEQSGTSQSSSPLSSQSQIPFTRSTHLINSSTTPSTDVSSPSTIGDMASGSTCVSTSTSSSSEQCKITRDASVLESLRWEKECSDEEMEKERIELYKANRRKRYENALEERRTSIAAVKRPYCISSSESIS